MYQIIALSFVLLLAACGTQKPAKIVMHEPSTAPKTQLKPTFQSDTPFKPVYGSVKLSQPVPVKEMKVEELSPPKKEEPHSSIDADSPDAIAVKKDDTLYSVARRSGIPAKELARINKLDAPYNIQGKTALKIKDDAAAAPQVVVEVPSALPEHGVVVANAPQPRLRPESTQISVSDGFKPFSVTPSLKAKNRFIWPVKGQVISRFGAKDGGLYNDGVNIAAPEGAPIHASMDGTVVYVGDALASYGNLLIIRHNNGLLTAYAHTQEILVKKGQKVKLGQVVAKVGQSGNVETPQVHFGIRDGKKPLDPVKKVRS